MRAILIVLLAWTFSGAAINRYWHVEDGGTGTRTEGDSWLGGVSVCMDTLGVATLTAGDIVLIKDGSHTIAAAIDNSAEDATEFSPIMLIGVKAGTTHVGAQVVLSDLSIDTTDRPLITIGESKITLGDYYIVKGLSINATVTAALTLGTGGLVENCKFNQAYGSSNTRVVLSTGTFCSILNCEFVSALNRGITLGATSKVMYCYFNGFADATNGIALGLNGNAEIVMYNTFRNVKNSAIVLASTDGHTIANNTFYDCAIDVSATDSRSNVFINNVSYATDADSYVWTSQVDLNFFSNNSVDALGSFNLVDTAGLFRDFYLKIGDPLFTTNGSNFSLQAASHCVDSGLGIIMGVGISGRP
jgi:hypothetical protein